MPKRNPWAQGSTLLALSELLEAMDDPALRIETRVLAALMPSAFLVLRRWSCAQFRGILRCSFQVTPLFMGIIMHISLD
jgi:hypothetical protein